MEGIIKSYRRGRHTQNTRQMIIVADGFSSKKEAESLIGKEVIYKILRKEKKGRGKEKMIKGKISAIHGNKGLVRAIFEKGLPGQSLGEKVEII